jgi:RNA polymerase sigma factor (sigma-70 family)
MKISLVNKKSFTDIYNEFFPIVYSMIIIKISDHDVTHDLTQEVFLKLYDKFDILENHRRWLLSSVKYAVWNYLRTIRKEEKNFNIDRVMEDTTMVFVNGMRETRIMIEEALDTLGFFGKEESRTLFDLVALHQYTYKETAEHLGMTERQVGYKYRNIVDKLMRHFKDKGVHGLEDLL